MVEHKGLLILSAITITYLLGLWTGDVYQLGTCDAAHHGHPSATRWKAPLCQAKPFPGFPAIASYGDQDRPVVVLLWDMDGDYFRHFLYVDPEAVSKCNCVFVTQLNPSCFGEADALIFLGPFADRLPSEKPPGQQWVLFNTEAMVNWQKRRHPHWFRQFDLRMTFELDAHVPYTYFHEGHHIKYDAIDEERRKGFLVMVISNCEALERNVLVAQLLQLLPIDSYGNCFNNMPMPTDLVDLPRHLAKIELFKRYQFALAFENARERHYVTEKLFDCFRAQTIPVYWGAPNVRQFLPHPQSAVLVDEFASLQALADHLLFLSSNLEQFNAYKNWSKNTTNGFSETLREGSPHSAPCRLCSLIEQLR